jgi:hypothetical protein
MRYFKMLAGLILMILTGCCAAPETETVKNSRQPMVIYREPVWLCYDEYSVFAYPVIAPWVEMTPEQAQMFSCFSQIYRTVYPSDNEENVFETISLLLNNGNFKDVNDVLLSYLLTDASVHMSDDELFERLDSITKTHVYSKHTDSVNYRLIGINHDTERVFRWYEMTWSYFIQVWNDDCIWAQPLIEGTEIDFFQAVFTETNNESLLLLNGYTRFPNGTGLTLTGTGFKFEDGLWAPLVWEEVFEETAVTENIKVYSDGIICARYPEWVGIPFECRYYDLILTDDGSFWADYPEDNQKELLFRLKNPLHKQHIHYRSNGYGQQSVLFPDMQYRDRNNGNDFGYAVRN